MTRGQAGIGFALATYLMWGLIFPIFFKLLSHVAPFEVLFHRMVWAMPATGLVLLAMGRTKDIKPTFANFRELRLIALAAIIITINWGVYVYAIGAGFALEVSLGYFMSPLVTVALGRIVFKEKLNTLQLVAIALTVLAVLMQIVLVGHLPLIGIVLATTFGFYSMLKKSVSVGPAQGFFVETVLVSPLALAGLFYLSATSGTSFTNFDGTSVLLILSGPLTMLALILYAAGAQRISLTTNGLMQYLAPSIIFVLAITAFGEAIDIGKFASFFVIWVALIIYTYAGLRGRA